ncbi:uncharacterized protein FMAN_03651 [Fusarium mangiferae]|uniref:Zn(2)-C6 fungal-type domain-containing protein n=1 Tax=Fusarium mangiferae TaxID=192010 RepID=A0A1L7T792_FUSMA|nr:uncharacterized protein FMAN_03651 [Fusarium mangiferae]CVK94628.1 uncharacterized protein FMAN_03651 [Fusarium mangiferae]
MVYPGRKSSGCLLCRERKIKCDERQPGCRRCETYRTPCPGYKRPLEVRPYFAPGNAIHVEGSEPTALRMQSIADVIGNSPLSPSSTGKLNFLQDESLMNYFLTQYSVPCRPGIYSGHLEFLPDLLASSSPTSPLWPATCALANLVLSRRYKSPDLYERARKSYGCALWSLNDNLSQVPDTWQDDTVAAIMLLHQIEVSRQQLHKLYLH